MIEVGRHNNANREERFCPFCPRAVEDEAHFMFLCPTYTHLRKRYLKPITDTYRSFEHLPNDQKMQILMSDMKQGICKFIFSSMGLREFLTSYPKMCD